MNAIIWSNQMSVLRSDYRTEKEYKQAYKDACQHYDFKVRVDGGWKFFAYADDLRTWKNQK